MSEAPTNAVNVALRLQHWAAERPSAVAIAEPIRRWPTVISDYRTVTFEQLAADVSQLAAGLVQIGVRPGMRLALLVRPGIDFIALVFALLRSGAVMILIDPGMGRRNLLRCLDDARPEGFVAISPVQAIRSTLRRRFAAAKLNVTVGRRWFWGGQTLAELRRTPADAATLPTTNADESAAIIFTTGSTGPPKGVLYTHGNFDRQVTEIQQHYGIEPGEIDLPCFPLFGLFNAAMGVTTVIPRMDFSRPASVDPRQIVNAVTAWRVTQSFASPAVWNVVGRHCATSGERLPPLRRVLAAGAPVRTDVLATMSGVIATDGAMFTPYGATEALPVASISAREVLADTAQQTWQGAGVCVGRKFAGIEWKVIAATDGPIASVDHATELPRGEIGELIVQGPVVTREYATRREANATAKIADGERFWHRMGDVGYLDELDRFWFCGRLAHRVLTAAGPMYTIPCEAIFNRHPAIARSALVGVGPAGRQTPVIVAEPKAGGSPRGAAARERLLAELADLALESPLTCGIRHFLLHKSFPVDIRHNAKIFREKLAVWAADQIGAAP